MKNLRPEQREARGSRGKELEASISRKKPFYTRTQPPVLPIACSKESVGTYCSMQGQGT